VNCRQNEEKVFPSLLEELDAGFVEARLHTDGSRGEELSDFQEQLTQSIATPLYLVIDPATERPLTKTLGGTVSVDSFRAFLEGAQKVARGEEKVGRLDTR
jgi:hypothetical protein